MNWVVVIMGWMLFCSLMLVRWDGRSLLFGVWCVVYRVSVVFLGVVSEFLWMVLMRCWVC